MELPSVDLPDDLVEWLMAQPDPRARLLAALVEERAMDEVVAGDEGRTFQRVRHHSLREINPALTSWDRWMVTGDETFWREVARMGEERRAAHGRQG